MTKPKLTIGLTGGIGSGKTAASDYFEKLGISVVDADLVAREVVEPGKTALSKISTHFGPSVITEAGELDRQALRQIIFDSPEEKAWLEALLHPIIRQTILFQLTHADSDYALLVSPLLFETDQHKLVDRTLLIDVDRDVQIERACKRDQTQKEQIEKIIQSQMSREDKQNKADDVIVNDRDLRYLHEQIESLHQIYLEMANDK